MPRPSGAPPRPPAGRTMGTGTETDGDGRRRSPAAPAGAASRRPQLFPPAGPDAAPTRKLRDGSGRRGNGPGSPPGCRRDAIMPGRRGEQSRRSLRGAEETLPTARPGAGPPAPCPGAGDHPGGWRGGGEVGQRGEAKGREVVTGCRAGGEGVEGGKGGAGWWVPGQPVWGLRARAGLRAWIDLVWLASGSRGRPAAARPARCQRRSPTHARTHTHAPARQGILSKLPSPAAPRAAAAPPAPLGALPPAVGSAAAPGGALCLPHPPPPPTSSRCLSPAFGRRPSALGEV